MAKRVAGVTEKLMECAKEEFLANGYENACLLYTSYCFFISIVVI